MIPSDQIEIGVAFDQLCILKIHVALHVSSVEIIFESKAKNLLTQRIPGTK